MRSFVIAFACMFGVGVATPAHANTWWTTTNVFMPATDEIPAVHQTVKNYAYSPGVHGDTANNTTLVLFLPGVGGVPNDYTLFLSEAASQGFFALGLDFINDTSTEKLCTCNSGCPDALGAQIVDGQTYSGLDSGFFSALFAPAVAAGYDFKAVVAYNSIVHRFAAFINHLVVQAPGPSWLQFCTLDGTGACAGPDWSKIVVSGHSQGGFAATWIVKHHTAVPKILLFSSPAPWNDLQPNSNADASPSFHDPTCTTNDQSIPMYASSFPRAKVRAFLSVWDSRYAPRAGDPLRNYKDNTGRNSSGNLAVILDPTNSTNPETRVNGCPAGPQLWKAPDLDPPPPPPPLAQWITVMDYRFTPAMGTPTEALGSAAHSSTITNGSAGTPAGEWCDGASPTFRTDVWDYMLTH